MKKIFPTIKRVAVFLFLAAVVPWMNMVIFLALLNHYADNELLYLLNNYSSQAYNNYYRASLLAFIVTYLIAKQLINKKITKKLWRTVCYMITYIMLFFIVLVSPI